MSMKIGNRSKNEQNRMNRKAIYTQRQYIHKGNIYTKAVKRQQKQINYIQGH